MKRLRRFFLGCLGLLAVAVLLLLIANAWLVRKSTGELRRREAAVIDAGRPLRLADLKREPVAAEQNAATHLKRAEPGLQVIAKELATVEVEGGGTTGKYTAEQSAKVAAVLASQKETFESLSRAAACDRLDFAHDVTLPHDGYIEEVMKSVSLGRSAARAMRARAMWQASEGQSDQAAMTSLELLRLARLYQQEPTVLSFLGSSAYASLGMEAASAAMASGELSPEARRRLDEGLVAADSLDGYRHAVRTEGASAVSALEGLPGSRGWLRRGLVNDGTTHLLDIINGYETESGMPFDQVLPLHRGRQVPLTWNVYRSLVEMMRPALDAARVPAERVRAFSRILRAKNAMQEKGLAKADGTMPPNLGSLGLPPEATVDPFTGQPLKVVRQDDRWNVYSCGADLKDDGGEFAQGKDVGFPLWKAMP